MPHAVGRCELTLLGTTTITLTPPSELARAIDATTPVRFAWFVLAVPVVSREQRLYELIYLSEFHLMETTSHSILRKCESHSII
jgi:hypothetical protein